MLLDASNPVFLPLLPQYRDALQAIYVTSMNYLTVAPKSPVSSYVTELHLTILLM